MCDSRKLSYPINSDWCGLSWTPKIGIPVGGGGVDTFWNHQKVALTS